MGTGYLIQAVLIVAWWIGISLSERFYSVFQFPGITHEMFSAFLIPDVAIIALLSLVRGYIRRRDLQLIILGAFLYATLFCVNAMILGGGGSFPTLVMSLGLAYNFFLCYGGRLFRPARPAGFSENMLKTMIQIGCVWTLSLVLIPVILLDTFNKHLIPDAGSGLWCGTLIFLIFSGLGLYSAWVMVSRGDGTPLPLNQTNKLVTSGPYAWIRNPMAVAGIGQGISISIAYASIPIFVYSILGLIVWHLAVRPYEEQDMKRRFGVDYEEYRADVGCWIPGLMKSKS